MRRHHQSFVLFLVVALSAVSVAPRPAQADASRRRLSLDVRGAGSVVVAPLHEVVTTSDPFLGLPAARAHVSVGEVHLSTAATRFWPSTATQIVRPGEILSRIGGASFRITPFRIQRVR